MSRRQEDTSRKYPYDDLVELNEALAELVGSNREGEPHIPTFARRMLERLREVGLLHTKDNEALENIRLVKLDKDQVLWLRFDTYRELAGYMAVEVVDAPRTDAAILAAMIAWGAEPIGFERVLKEIASERAWQELWQELKLRGSVELSELWAMSEKAEAYLKDLKNVMVEGKDTSSEEWEPVFRSLRNFQDRGKDLAHLSYLLHLLRYYRPEFDKYSLREKLELITRADNHIKDYLESLQKLQAFLGYGTPNRKLMPTVKEPKRDVRVAILYDVEGLNYRQIGERMKIPLPPDADIKGEHQTVRKMVERGRRILEKAFGEEGWRERAKAMKAQKAWWWSLSREERDKERDIELTALGHRISIEEARQWVERRRS